MKKHLDLRGSLRLTVADGRTILDALNVARAPAKHIRAKLLMAIQRATHECDRRAGGRCSVCGEDPSATARLRKMRADAFRRALRNSAALQRKLDADAKCASMSIPHVLRLVDRQRPGSKP